MSQDKNYFSREEALYGPVGRRVARLLFFVEMRTAFFVKEAHRALMYLLTKRDYTPTTYSDQLAMKAGLDEDFEVRIQDLEKYAVRWAELLPGEFEPRVLAGFVRALSDKYKFARADVPNLVHILSLNTDEVQKAFESLYDEPLETVFATETTPDDRPFWGRSLDWLSPEAIRFLQDHLEFVFLEWGDELFHQGDDGDSLYVLISGRLRAIHTDERGHETNLGEYCRGAILGEIAVLTEESRAATILAVRDSELLRLSREGISQLLHEHPEAGIFITSEMVKRLRSKPREYGAHVEIGTLALIPASEDVPIRTFAENLVEALKAHGHTLLLDVQRFSELLGSQMDVTDLRDRTLRSQTLYMLEHQENQYRFVVYLADPELTPWTNRCISQADRIIVVGDASGSTQLGEVEETLYGKAIDKISIGRELVLLHPSPESVPTGTIHWLKPRTIMRHHHVALNHKPHFERLARILSGNAVGLALSGGGGRGMVHIGVHRALVEEGFAVDFVAGTSFGSIVAGVIGSRFTVSGIDDAFRHFSENVGHYFDLTIPTTAFVSGKRVNALFKEYFGAETCLEDLWVPLCTVSANLTRAAMMIHDQGPVWRYIRASASIPSIFPPLLENGELLVDGGVFNNLPTDVLQARMGGGFVIGVNASPRGRVKEEYNFGDSITVPDVLFRRKSNPAPSLFDVVARTMSLGNNGAWQTQMDACDLLIDVPTDNYNMFDFAKYDELVALGYDTAKQIIQTWKKELTPARQEMFHATGMLRGESH